jgi:hypothetical protein
MDRMISTGALQGCKHTSKRKAGSTYMVTSHMKPKYYTQSSMFITNSRKLWYDTGHIQLGKSYERDIHTYMEA